MSKMDTLLIYNQRREKRTMTMKIRSCDLIFFLAAPHSTPWMLSKSAGLLPASWGLYPIYVDLKP